MNRNLIIATSAEDGFYNNRIWNSARNFDIALIDFAEHPTFHNFLVESARGNFNKTVEYYVHDRGFKHHIYKRFIEKYDILDKYDWIWMPDYDVHVQPKVGIVEEIEHLFNVAKDYNLNICQPSLTDDSYCSFPIVKNDPTKFLRYTNYVEIMCPLFKTEALRKVLGSFTVTYSGWAQDFLWARDLNYERLAIIDDVQVKHVKPVESQHWVLPNGLNADQELDHVIKLMGLDKDVFWPKTIGGIDRWK